MNTTRNSIRGLLQLGCSEPEIARRLDLAPTTVSYHIRQLQAPPQVESLPSRPPDPTGMVKTRERVAECLSRGLSRAETAAALGIGKSTVTYHARRLGETVDSRCARRYDWDAVQRFYDAGHGVRACMQAFGFSSASWAEAVKRGAVRARPAGTPLDDLLVAGVHRGRNNLKLRLIAAGLKSKRCERCGIDSWRGLPLTMALHHVNGVRNDNRLENLELLCPNCHSQTDTFAGRNGRASGGMDLGTSKGRSASAGLA